MYKKIVGILLTATMVLLCGCGRRADGEEIAKELGQYDVEATNGDAVEKAGVNEETGIPNHVTETIVGENGYEYVIDADVVSDGYLSASVYEMSMPKASDELVKRYADKLFDDGAYSVVKPYEMMTFEELQEELSFWKTLIEADDKGEITLYPAAFDDASEVENLIAGYSGEKPTSIISHQLLFEQNFSIVEQDEEELKTYYQTRLRGKVNGDWWEMYYVNCDNWNSTIECMSLVAGQTEYDFVQSDEGSTILYGDNRADASACKNAADEFMKRLGMDDKKCVHSANIVCQNEEAEAQYFENGYRLNYTNHLELQGVFTNMNMAVSVDVEQFANDSSKDICALLMDAGQGAIQDDVSLYVSEQGVYKVMLENIFDVEKKMSDKTTMLTFEQVMDVAGGMIHSQVDANEPAGNNSMDETISAIELRYVIVPYESGCYTMVPAWIFYYNIDSGDSDAAYVKFGVNAIDGSVICFMDHGGGSVKMWGYR